MHLQVSTQFSRKSYIEFNWFNFIKSKNYKIFVPLILFFYGAMILALFNISWDDDDFIGLGLLGIVVLCELFLLFILIIQPVSIFKSVYKRSLTTQHFKFDDEGFSIHTENDFSTSDAQFKYEAILKAYETDQYYFLYTGPAVAFIINKLDFASEMSKDMSTLFREKIETRSIVKCHKK